MTRISSDCNMNVGITILLSSLFPLLFLRRSRVLMIEYMQFLRRCVTIALLVIVASVLFSMSEDVTNLLRHPFKHLILAGVLLFFITASVTWIRTKVSIRSAVSRAELPDEYKSIVTTVPTAARSISPTVRSFPSINFRADEPTESVDHCGGLLTHGGYPPFIFLNCRAREDTTPERRAHTVAHELGHLNDFNIVSTGANGLVPKWSMGSWKMPLRNGGMAVARSGSMYFAVVIAEMGMYRLPARNIFWPVMCLLIALLGVAVHLLRRHNDERRADLFAYKVLETAGIPSDAARVDAIREGGECG